MRITNNILVNNMINHIGKNLIRMDKYQQKLASGKKITVPSDDPVVAARALKLRTDVAQIEQYKTNVKDALSWLEITESAITNVGDILQRARELAVQASSSGTTTADDTKKIQQEVEQLKNQLIKLGNSTYAGRYVFSGFKTDTKLMDDDGNFNVAVNNTEAIIYQIGISDSININVTGGDLFNAGNNTTIGTKGQLIQDFEDFMAALNSGDHDLISDAIANIDNNFNHVLRIRADVGARYNRLELTSDRLDIDSLNFKKLMSENEDVDEAENILLLKSEENVYRASLSGGARIIQTSLVDFLR
ncbi:flagellar hook-associated protein FlgL [Acetivibrio mesophilus]|uniref:Flagellar hook-associated protein FlgL n=1 Tax=Acetivibrio mesophilus TaxID=2487273 RepID=A0A4V1K228_9FIRM|nr:flagellar hook-associated protein FlgL [Acetivibrio mesophilus]RXE58839.1 flagellar hook-associated protein FlgL [Acetivibrio mesophilus]